MDIITYWNRFCAPYLRAQTKTERGASLVEYALLVALIAIVAIGAISFLTSRVGNTFSKAASSLN